jgi:hypothetical protein
VVNGSAGARKLRRRSSTGSIPSSTEARSITRSRYARASGRPAAERPSAWCS